MPTERAIFDRVILLDVQGLFGGRDLWIAADGEAHGRIVRPPGQGQSSLQETRFCLTVPAAEMGELRRLLERHDVGAIQTQSRCGVPDEARPVLCVQCGGEIRAVGKWANDAHPRFDAIYRFLIRISELGAAAAPAAPRPWDRNWQPPGFPQRRTILDLARPALDE